MESIPQELAYPAKPYHVVAEPYTKFGCADPLKSRYWKARTYSIVHTRTGKIILSKASFTLACDLCDRANNGNEDSLVNPVYIEYFSSIKEFNELSEDEKNCQTITPLEYASQSYRDGQARIIA